MEHGSDINAGFMVFLFLIWAAGIAIFIIPFWKIYEKAGFSKWLSLLIIVPVVNLIVLYVVAFSTWPAHRGGE